MPMSYNYMLQRQRNRQREKWAERMHHEGPRQYLEAQRKTSRTGRHTNQQKTGQKYAEANQTKLGLSKTV